MSARRTTAAVGYLSVVSLPPAAVADAAPDPAAPTRSESAFEVRVEGFTGPFDLLLSLIAKHKLEVTAMALHSVTDDFVAHLRNQGDRWDLDETTEFLVVAAILLDLKAARLLPGDVEEDEEDLALLEARDLLFARLLQYRAFKDASEFFGERLYAAPARVPARVGMDSDLAALLPEVEIPGSHDDFAAAASRALTPRKEPEVGVAHIHAPAVSVRDQAAVVVARLRRHDQLTFRALVSDAPDIPHVIARFLALLELFREQVVAFEQAGPLADLLIRWTGGDDGQVDVHDEFDDDAPPVSTNHEPEPGDANA
jgi:segregation and condensation protein A